MNKIGENVIAPVERLTLYLAGRMSGVPEWNFPEFLRTELALWEAGFNVINPARMDLEAGFEPRGATGLESTPGISRRDVLKKDMVAICDYAHGIALLDGWEQSPGANAEKALAHALPIWVMTVDEWLSKGNAGWAHSLLGDPLMPTVVASD